MWVLNLKIYFKCNICLLTTIFKCLTVVNMTLLQNLNVTH